MKSLLLTATVLILTGTVQCDFFDNFNSYNSSLWTQNNDIEHCNDGACFEARPDHLVYGANGLTMIMNQVRIDCSLFLLFFSVKPYVLENLPTNMYLYVGYRLIFFSL